MLDNFGVAEGNWRDALDPTTVEGYPTAPDSFATSESPRYVGRAVAALADPERARWNPGSPPASTPLRGGAGLALCSAPNG